MSESDKNPPKKVAKILVMGLDNSGKTSILLSVQKDVNLLSYYSLKPTPGVDILTIDKQDTRFHIWDFGGQKQYRDEYIKNLDKYVQKANKMIYVIDVQDKERYELALQYFTDIFKMLKNQKSLQLSIYLHKFDPHLEGNEQYSYKKISTSLIDKISAIIPSGVNYNIFKTTIFTTFRKTLLESVSDEFFSIL